jgi:hypothetical protein
MKMGRPKLKKADVKRPFPMRFSDDELSRFKMMARADKLTVREWITKTLLEKVLVEDAKRLKASLPKEL